MPPLRRIEAAIERGRRPGGALVRSEPTRAMALWVMAMLLAYLVLYYLR